VPRLGLWTIAGFDWPLLDHSGPINPRTSQTHLLRIGVLASAALVILAGALWWLGDRHAAPNLHPVGQPPADLDARVVSFPGLSGEPIRGWLLPGTGDAAVLLMHGSGGDRRGMLGQARFLHEAGYSVLTIDLRGNGESPGGYSTEGFRESLDAHAAVAYLRSLAGVRRVAIIGFSLGGAAALLGPQGPVAADALVLEAVYPTIEEAVADRIRIRLGPWSGWLHPLFTWQIRLRLGLTPANLRPIERIGAVRAPVFVIGGAEDRHTTPAETHRLFAAAPEPKRLWLVPGAAHGACYSTAPEEYRARVLAFLAEALGRRD
jgi:uncharacterized protein